MSQLDSLQTYRREVKDKLPLKALPQDLIRETSSSEGNSRRYILTGLELDTPK